MPLDHDRCISGSMALSEPTWYPACKAVIDAVLAMTLLILGGPLILALMVLVRLTSAGPAIYAQTRWAATGGRSRSTSPDHGPRLRAAVGPVLVDGRRPAGDAARPMAPPVSPRRAAAALERGPGAR